MYPTRWLIALGLGAFALGLFLNMPLHMLLSPVPLDRWGIAVQETSGSLLAGEARLATKSGTLNVDWTLRPWHLFVLQFRADWHARLDDIKAAGQLGLAPWGGSVVVARAEIPANSLDALLRQWRAGVDQPLTVDGLTLSLWPTGKLRDAGGELAWGGGMLRVSGRESITMPSLLGLVRRDAAVIEAVVVADNDRENVLARARYDTQTKELHLVLLQRGADLLGQKASSRPADTAVFEMKQTFP